MKNDPFLFSSDPDWETWVRTIFSPPSFPPSDPVTQKATWEEVEKKDFFWAAAAIDAKVWVGKGTQGKKKAGEDGKEYFFSFDIVYYTYVD